MSAEGVEGDVLGDSHRTDPLLPQHLDPAALQP